MSKQIGARTREKWVDDVKVIACILVVVGHFFQSMVKASILPDSGLYEWFITTVYYFHSLVDYNKHVDRYVFVVRAEDHAEEFIKKHCAAYGIHDVKIVELDHMTDGQATTCMLAIPYCDQNSSIMVYNIDTYVEPNEMKYEDISGDGHIPCFHADGDHWSFVKLNSEGKAIEVREKKRISDNCTLERV